MELEQALAIVKAAGYRVTKPRAEKVERPMLNALGKSFSALYDPKYKPHYRFAWKRLDSDSVGMGIGADRWAAMCEIAKRQWQHSIKTGEPLPFHIGRDG